MPQSRTEANENRSGDQYSSWVGLIFVFNLIVGTGALTLPAVFARAGWALGFAVVCILAFISYMTVTFLIETTACANAILHWKRLQFLKRDSAVSQSDASEGATGAQQSSCARNERYSNSDDEDNAPLLGTASSNSVAEEGTVLSYQHQTYTSRYYVLDEKIELGEMAGLFFNDFGRILFYLCISVYLYGDLSIYSAAVSKTLRDVICPINTTSTIGNSSSDLDAELCWEEHTLTRLDIYRLCLIAFVSLLGPFTFFNVQKTKYIQVVTVIFRWLAFTVMIGAAINRLVTIGAQAHPPAGNIHGLPALFGTCVYSFMCHHSLPSIIAPISDKRNVRRILSLDYGIICAFYVLLAMTGIFAFANLQDLYTLNFMPTDDEAGRATSLPFKILEYFLALFPVFTLSTSFPIIAITLRNNLQTLFLDMTNFESYGLFLRRFLFPLLAITPPLAVTFFTESLTSLVSFTGAYAGTGIQYLIPIALVYSARRTCTDLLGQGIQNEYRSSFKSVYWLIAVLIWSCACVCLVTVNFFITASGGTHGNDTTTRSTTIADIFWSNSYRL